MLPFRVRLGGRMEEIQKHVASGGDFGKQQLDGIGRALPR